MFFILFATHTHKLLQRQQHRPAAFPHRHHHYHHHHHSYLCHYHCCCPCRRPAAAASCGHTIDLSVVAFTFQSLPLSLEAGPAALCLVPSACWHNVVLFIVFCACPHTYILISQVWHRERGKALPSFLLLSLFSSFSSFPLALSIIQQFSDCSINFSSLGFLNVVIPLTIINLPRVLTEVSLLLTCLFSLLNLLLPRLLSLFLSFITLAKLKRFFWEMSFCLWFEGKINFAFALKEQLFLFFPYFLSYLEF